MEFFKQEPKITESEVKNREVKAKEEGRIDKIREIIEDLYASNGSTINQLFIHLELNRLEKKMGLEENMLNTIERVTRAKFIGWTRKNGYEDAIFDPEIHASYDKMVPGERCIVSTVGCELGGELYKKPIVRRKK